MHLGEEQLQHSYNLSCDRYAKRLDLYVSQKSERNIISHVMPCLFPKQQKVTTLTPLDIYMCTFLQQHLTCLLITRLSCTM